MIKDGGFRFETQLKIEFLPPNNSSKNAWKNPCNYKTQEICKKKVFLKIFLH